MIFSPMFIHQIVRIKVQTAVMNIQSLINFTVRLPPGLKITDFLQNNSFFGLSVGGNIWEMKI